MIGYSEVIQTMAAMIIFSVILMNANHMIHRNTVMQVEGELEQEVIAIGQEIIEEARTKAFDENTYNPDTGEDKLPPSDIPGGFTNSPSLGLDSGDLDAYANCPSYERTCFDDFDDYNGWEEVSTTPHGDFNLSVEVFYVDENTFEETGDKSTFKKIEVSITSEFLRDNTDTERSYKLEFIRNYYAD